MKCSRAFPVLQSTLLIPQLAAAKGVFLGLSDMSVSYFLWLIKNTGICMFATQIFCSLRFVACAYGEFKSVDAISIA